MDNLRFGRAAVVAIIVGVGLIVLVPASSLAGGPVVEFVRETVGVTRPYFAARAFFNFLGGGLLNLVAFQSFALAAILLALRGRTLSQYPGLPTNINND